MTELPDFICADTDTEGDFLQKEELRLIFAEIDALPELQREILLMKYLLCFSNRDIAEILGIGANNVGVTLHRAIDKIKKNLRKIS